MHPLNTEITFRVALNKEPFATTATGFLFKFRVGSRYKYLVVHPDLSGSVDWYVVSDYRSGRYLTAPFYHPEYYAPTLIRRARSCVSRVIRAHSIDHILARFNDYEGLNPQVPA